MKWLLFLIYQSVSLLAVEYPFSEHKLEEITSCFKLHGVDNLKELEEFSALSYQFLAEDLLLLHDYPILFPDSPQTSGLQLTVGYADFLTSACCVTAGLLLLRYPPPVRNYGVSLITYGLGTAGYDYLKEFIQHLIDRGIIKNRDRKIMEDVIKGRIYGKYRTK